MSGPTPYLESNALLAAQENDTEEVRDILRRMLPGERRHLRDAATRLIITIDAVTGLPGYDGSEV